MAYQDWKRVIWALTSEQLQTRYIVPEDKEKVVKS